MGFESNVFVIKVKFIVPLPPSTYHTQRLQNIEYRDYKTPFSDVDIKIAITIEIEPPTVHRSIYISK